MRHHLKWQLTILLGVLIAGAGLFFLNLPLPTALDASLVPSVVSASQSQAEPATPIAQVPAKPQFQMPDATKTFLNTHCADCHTGDKPDADLNVSSLMKPGDDEAQRKWWVRIRQQVQAGAMPPAEAGDGPSPKARAEFLAWIEKRLNDIDCDLAQPLGRTTIRRLNQVEFSRTIFDLTGVKFQGGRTFPADDVGLGFDNVAEVLSLSPLLFEKYLAAAEKIVGKVMEKPRADLLNVALDKGKHKGSRPHFDKRRKSLTFSSNGQSTFKINVPEPGKYRVWVRAGQDRAGDEPAKMLMNIGKSKQTKSVKSRSFRPKAYEQILELEKGSLEIQVGFLNDHWDPKARDRSRRDRNLHIYGIELIPQFTSKRDVSANEPVLICWPKGPRDETACARKILENFANKAYRRPVTRAEVDRLVGLYQQTRDQGDSYESALGLSLQAVLISPKFLFRHDMGRPIPKHAKTTVEVPLSDHELASRLSYFLWSTMPDQTLRDLADQGKLRDDKILQQQVKRMLDDPKSDALVKNFFGQWLGLRGLKDVTIEKRRYRNFTEELRDDMLQETYTFLTHLKKENRPLPELLDARYTFVNERLARLYDLGNVRGNEFRKVDLRNDRRGGILTHASVLTLTSNPNRTSPVKRGKWILEVLLGEPPPPPPPDVDELPEPGRRGPRASLRDQLKVHRAKASCAACHVKMDAMGLALENYNAIGQWRDRDGRFEIDATGELPGWGKFDGPAQLRSILAKESDPMINTLTKNMLVYALGRGLKRSDQCEVERIVAQSAKGQHRFSHLILAIVASDLFQKTATLPPAGEPSS